MFVRKRIKPPAFAEVNEARITDTYEPGVIAFTPFWKEAKISELFHPNHCSYCFMVANLWSNTVIGVHLQTGNCTIYRQRGRKQSVEIVYCKFSDVFSSFSLDTKNGAAEGGVQLINNRNSLIETW
jgi:hypothetical protein